MSAQPKPGFRLGRLTRCLERGTLTWLQDPRYRARMLLGTKDGRAFSINVARDGRLVLRPQFVPKEVEA